MRKRFFTPGSLSFREPRLRASRAAAEIVLTALPEAQEPMHEPPLEPRDEVIFLLTAAAEIEHALMVQYLYAAYSLRVVSGDPNFQQLKDVQDLLLQIAREEMGHLITIQNLLHLVGGPLNFNREHSPYASEIYPFRFKLEPLTLDSLSKYVIAESPLQPPPSFPPEDVELLRQIEQDAKRSNDGVDVNHVGPIFARLENLFKGRLKDEDFRLDTKPFQAKFDDWGFEPKNAPSGEKLIIETITSSDVTEVRTAAVAAVRNIGQQGEAHDPESASPGQSESHFERFFDIYKRIKALPSGPLQLTWPVAENPNTTTPPEEAPSLMKMMEVIDEAHESKGRINNPRARGWAHLFNLRYRMLLMSLAHFLRLNQELYAGPSGPRQGDRTPRGLLLIWTFNEMRRLKKIAGKLVQLPKDDPPGNTHAGPPFELPYTLNLPDRETDRWGAHLDVSRAAVRLIRETLQPAEPAEDGFLADLVRLDEHDQVIIQSLAGGGGVPEGSLPADFRKVVMILEEAVRGFDIIVPGAIPPAIHGNFWDGLKRNDFIKHKVAGPIEIIKKNPDNSFDADGSPLIRRLKGTGGVNRMPRFRPPVPDERIEFIRQWISGGCQQPGDPGVNRERNPAPETVAPPAPPLPPGTLLSFATDIKGLFRDTPDRNVMLAISGFDLHKFEDVRDNADRILARIEDGTMPCDGSWLPDKIAKFRKWLEDGKQP